MWCVVCLACGVDYTWFDYVTTWYANSGVEHSVTTWCGVCGLQGGV